MKKYLWLLVGCVALVALLTLAGWSRLSAGRVLALGVAFPTENKPQSKLWFAHDAWWAWLPDAAGSSIWKREQGRWRRVTSLDAWLAQVPGHADVWSDDEGVSAVVVGPRQLAVARLQYDAASNTYVAAAEPVIWPLVGAPSKPASWSRWAKSRWQSQLEESLVTCATIARDARGQWWIAYDQAGRIWVRHALDRDGTNWEEPQAISQELAADDLCSIFALADGVGVAWTDQAQGAIRFRHHELNAPPGEWREPETVAQGDQLVNNHLHAAVARDGTAYIVSKSAQYVPHQPLLWLRTRRPGGAWESVAYAEYTTEYTPTRPIAVLTPDDSHLWLINALLDNSRANAHAVEARCVIRASPTPPAIGLPVIGPHFDMQNPTSCKNRLPAAGPWIVLGSDRFGNVFEGGLPKPAQ